MRIPNAYPVDLILKKGSESGTYSISNHDILDWGANVDPRTLAIFADELIAGARGVYGTDPTYDETEEFA